MADVFPAVFMACWKAELDRDGFPILHNMAYLFIVTLSMYRADSERKDNTGVKVRETNNFLLETVPSEQQLKDGKNFALCNIIFNQLEASLTRKTAILELVRTIQRRSFSSKTWRRVSKASTGKGGRS